MAHVPNPTIQQIVGSIGLDTLSEGVTDPLGHALADAAGGIAETERAKRFLSGILGGLSPAQLGHLQTAVRWNGRLAGSTLKAFAGVILRRHHVNHGMTSVVIDAIDDTVEILSRRTEAALTPAQIQIYVGQGVDNAVAHPSTTTSASATAAANNGANMPGNPVDAEMPREVAAGTPEAQALFGELWGEILAAINGDSADERAEARRSREAICALLRLRAGGAMEILNGINHGVPREACKDVFLAAADAALIGGPSIEAKLGDLFDRLVKSEDRIEVMNEIKFLTRTTFEVAKAGLAVSGLIFLGLGAVVIISGSVGTIAGGVCILTSTFGHVNVIALVLSLVAFLVAFVIALIMSAMLEGAISTAKWMMASVSAPVRKLGQLFDALISQYIPIGTH